MTGFPDVTLWCMTSAPLPHPVFDWTMVGYQAGLVADIPGTVMMMNWPPLVVEAPVVVVKLTEPDGVFKLSNVGYEVRPPPIPPLVWALFR